MSEDQGKSEFSAFPWQREAIRSFDVAHKSHRPHLRRDERPDLAA